MATALIDPRHLAFVLYDLLDAEALLQLPAFRDHDRADADAVLAVAEAMSRDIFLPSYQLLDRDEPRLENGRVVLPSVIAETLAVFRDGGFCAMAADPVDGGLGLPRTFANAAFLFFQAANISIANYPMLTMSAAELLAHHGTPEQKARYMAPMLEGRFFGTMALSEPQAGSSLGDITTRARPRADGRYALSGTKMWISGGEHDMGENIVHLMLARIEGAPRGVRGISLFITPRLRLDVAGRPIEWNHIAVAGLNHKMGQRGTVNTVLNVGEGGETIGELVGRPGEGLACMFTMMNEARIGVATGAVAHASAGYRLALAYARERRQGRLPDAKDPASPQVALIEHADVRRMLLQQKSVAEGGVAMALLLARLADEKKASTDDATRRDAALLLDFLTPVFKAWFSEECLAASSSAMQVLGGAGYTRDHPLEQHYRDNRLNPIHEGTNGIQAIDLLGRKAVMADGRALALFLERMETSASKAAQTPDLVESARQLRAVVDDIRAATSTLGELNKTSGAHATLSHAADYMELVGCASFAWIWLEQARAATRRRATGLVAEADFLAGMVGTARHVLAHALPRASAARWRIGSGGPTALAVTDAMLG